MEGRPLSAEEALALGLVTRICDESEIDDVIGTLEGTATRLDAQTVAAIRVVTLQADYDADLAALVRSASNEGLRDRICNYAAQLRG
jgi:enoyl-CoA hydratase/carnithine racemase